MNSTQNKKIEQVKETTMIVGIDVGSEKHYFRAFNWRGIELTRKPVAYTDIKNKKIFYWQEYDGVSKGSGHSKKELL